MVAGTIVYARVRNAQGVVEGRSQGGQTWRDAYELLVESLAEGEELIHVAAWPLNGD